LFRSEYQRIVEETRSLPLTSQDKGAHLLRPELRHRSDSPDQGSAPCLPDSSQQAADERVRPANRSAIGSPSRGIESQRTETGTTQLLSSGMLACIQKMHNHTSLPSQQLPEEPCEYVLMVVSPGCRSRCR